MVRKKLKYKTSRLISLANKSFFKENSRIIMSMSAKRTIYLFLCFTILQAIFNNLVHPVTPAFLHSLNVENYVFGVAYACFSFTNFLGSLFWGEMANRWSLAHIFFVSLLGYAFSQYLFMSSEVAIDIFIARGISGIFAAGFLVSGMNFFVDYTSDQERGKYLTINAIINVVCATIGYFIGGRIGDIDLLLPFKLQIMCMIVLAVGYIFLLKPLPRHTNHISKGLFIKDLSTTIKALTPLSVTFFVSVLLISLGNTAFDQSFNYYLRDVFLMPPSANGNLKAIIGVFTLVSNLSLTFYLMRRIKLTLSQLLVVGVCSISAIGLLFMNQQYLFVGIALILLAGLSIIQPLQQQTVTLLSNDKGVSHRLMGFFNAIKYLGAIVGAFLSGVLYNRFPLYPFILVAVVMGLSLVTLFILVRKESKDELLSRN